MAKYSIISLILIDFVMRTEPDGHTHRTTYTGGALLKTHNMKTGAEELVDVKFAHTRRLKNSTIPYI